VIGRILLAGAGILLAALAAGAAGAMIAASLALAFAGLTLPVERAPAISPVLDLPDRPPGPTPTAPRLEQISGQLSIGMSDGIYFDRVIRPLLSRIARDPVADDGGRRSALDRGRAARRAPSLRELDEMVHRMEPR
jgi:hypothetical protein